MTSLPEHQNSNLFDLVGRVALVTGSNRGNGYAIAKGLNEVGAKVIRIDIAFDSKLNTDDYEFDLTNIAEIPSLIEKISSKHGRIDALINNAGVSISSANPYNDIGAYDKTLTVNLHAAFSLCSTVCPVMAANKGGAIVNITSLGAELAFPDNPSYQISKAGLRQLTKALARDWADKGIRANNICPGYIKTSMTEKSYNDPTLNEQRKNHMILKRWGQSSDLVGPTIFLISDASAYISGSDLYVDGGWTANGL